MKSESIWKVLAISVALLMVASVASAVNVIDDSSNDAENKALDSDETSSVDASSIPINKHPKMSTEVAAMIPPPGIALPPEPVIVNIYLTEDREEYTEKLKEHVVEILYSEERKVVAKIYTSEILEIADLPFVSYINTPIIPALFPEAPSNGAVGFFSIGVYKHPKMSTEVAASIPPPGLAPPPEPMIVNIYLTENKTEYIEDLRNHSIRILYIEENRIVAEIYTSEILEIVDLPFVSYINTPITPALFPEATSEDTVDSFGIGVYKHPKMSTEVAACIPPPGIAPPPEPMIVNVYLKENKTEKIKELENYTIEILYVKENRIVAEIYTKDILDIADLPFVSYMDTPLKAQLFPDEPLSEGLKCLNTEKLHGLNITGKGVKVAIVDFGFEGYEDLLGTGLPENVTVRSFRGDGDITGGGEIHGTGCAEIVHDVAPDAELYLVNYDGYTYQLGELVLPYLISEEVDILSHSAGSTAGLFDGTDYSCRIIDDAWYKHGILWVNAAGNSAQRHWEGMFNDTDDDGFHEFLCPGGELGQTIFANKGDTFRIWLSWNDTWDYPTQDYDLLIYDLDINLLDYSVNPQNGSFGQHPYEICCLRRKAPYTGEYYIVIYNYGATKPVHFELYSWYHSLGCKVENSSLCVEATALGSIAAGAVDCRDCSTLEPYSSRGPTNDGRLKPDFVGPDCVSTCAYSPYPFCGTSAATPHVAGAFALQLSCIKQWHPGQKDNQYGYGLPKFCNCSGVN